MTLTLWHHSNEFSHIRRKTCHKEPQMLLPLTKCGVVILSSFHTFDLPQKMKVAITLLIIAFLVAANAAPNRQKDGEIHAH